MNVRRGRLIVTGVVVFPLISLQLGAFLPLSAAASTHGAALTPPTFLSTLAGPSVAAMYASGVGWDANLERIVVADTGNNQIEFFSPFGTLLGSFGTFGTGSGQFNSPRQVAIDSASNIYVADAGNNRVQAFNSSGGFLWSAGGTGSATCSSCLSAPIGVSYDATDNQVLVADTGHSLVKAYDAATGHFLWASPSGKSTLGFTNPRDATRGPGGYIWVAAYNQNEIRAYAVTSNGAWTDLPAVVLGSGSSSVLSLPYNVDFSPDQHTAYVADIGNDRIDRWNITTLSKPVIISPAFGSRCFEPCGNPPADTGKFAFLRRVAVETNGPDEGDIIGDDFWGNGLNIWQADGTFALQIDGVHAPAPGFAQAYGIGVNASNGYTYGVDRLNQRLEEFDGNGTFVTAAGFRGSASGTSCSTAADSFSWPEAVAVAPDGSIWAADTRNGRLEHWPANLATKPLPSVIGCKGSGLGQYNYIEGVTVDDTGIVWAADTLNNRIETYNPSNQSFITYGGTKAGSGNCQFNNPEGVAVTSSGTVYVADTLNNRIEEFTDGGNTCNYVASTSSSVGLSGPQGIALSGDGTLWVADTGNDRIVHLSASLVDLGDDFGSLGTGELQFDAPHSLGVYNTTLIVADTYNNRVQEFDILGS
jgi:tripartite motif-containing protein 71